MMLKVPRVESTSESGWMLCVDPQGARHVVIACPECGFQSATPIAEIPNKGRMRLECDCGFSRPVYLDDFPVPTH